LKNKDIYFEAMLNGLAGVQDVNRTNTRKVKSSLRVPSGSGRSNLAFVRYGKLRMVIFTSLLKNLVV